MDNTGNQDGFMILDKSGFFEYGAVIPSKKLREIYGIAEIEYPAMKHEINTQALQELAVTDYIRNKLLNDGKYLKGERDSYRVLIPSENAAQVLSYMNSADNKLKRGLKLNRNTPSQYRINNNDEVRAKMKQEHCKDEQRKAKNDPSG